MLKCIDIDRFFFQFQFQFLHVLQLNFTTKCLGLADTFLTTDPFVISLVIQRTLVRTETFFNNVV